MLYRWIRDLHLYFGLFISPFVLLFAASVFYLNHGTLLPGTATTESFQELQIPDGLDRLKGKEAVDRAQALLPQVGVEGEIGFLRYVVKDVRGNWMGTQIWRWLADTTIYLLLFISISGVYMWWAIKAERKIGAALLTAGTLTFAGLVYAIVR